MMLWSRCNIASFKNPQTKRRIGETQSTKADLLDAARYRAMNDSYWLVAPFKLTDPGAVMVEEGTQKIDEVNYRRLHLSFAPNTGLTAGDEFWLYLNPNTGLMDRWAFYLESFEGEATLAGASEREWLDWKQFNDVLISTTRKLIRSPQFEQFKTGQIDFPVLRFLDHVDDQVFVDPRALIPSLAATL